MSMKKYGKTELLAPAGSIEKLRYAIEYGADAVYAGMPSVSMRARVNSFSEESLAEAVKHVHAFGKKIYIAINIYAHNYHIPGIERHLKFLKKLDVDAIIISDPGVIMLVKKYLPDVDIHLSTQANTTNWMAAKFWHEAGVRRIILAREVTLEDIKMIHKKVPKLELEYFVHGAMCMSYSGRCILSKWMSGKSANEGGCTQPCRWAYAHNFKFPIFNLKSNPKSKFQDSNKDSGRYIAGKVREIKSGQEIELEEDSHGTYFFNSKDLNLIEHLKELKDAGVTSFKIEGRSKSVYYVVCVTRAYRKVLDAIESGKMRKEIKKIQKWAQNELEKLSNRGYTKGFLFGNEAGQNLSGQQSNEQYQFVGEVVQSNKKELKVKIHNALRKGDALEIITGERNIPIKALKIYNKNKDEVESAHGGHDSLYYIETDKKDIKPLSLIRKLNYN